MARRTDGGFSFRALVNRAREAVPDFFGDANLEADICHEYDVDKNRSLASFRGRDGFAIVTSLMNNVIKTAAATMPGQVQPPEIRDGEGRLLGAA